MLLIKKCFVFLKAEGGSGEYVWSTSDISVISVNIKGQISTVGPGKCNVTAADAKNSAYYGSSIVSKVIFDILKLLKIFLGVKCTW